ncbi:MAG: protein kinase domain-containing protein [Fimbriiglobus sp.]
MGIVYKARQSGLNRIVALKVIHAGRHAITEDLVRFRQEAEAVAAIQHPNIVQVYEIGESEDVPYFSLEYVSGGTLSQYLNGNPVEPNFAAAMTEQLARAMSVAHEQTIIHRDLKPANILLQIEHSSSVNSRLGPGSKGGSSASKRPGDLVSIEDRHGQRIVPKITDFGLAKRLDRDVDLTMSGVVAGTPQYMAPEQVTGIRSNLGASVDIHALGVIFYEMLTGVTPFAGKTPIEAMNKVMKEVPLAPRHFGIKVPKDLETICMKCLEKSPARRYQSTLALAADLERYRLGMPIEARSITTPERATRWVKRNPVIAFSGIALAVMLTVATMVSTYFAISASQAAEEAQHHLQTARTNEGIAQDEQAKALIAAESSQVSAEKAKEAEKATRAALDREKALVEKRQGELYAAQMQLAKAAWNDGNCVRLDRLLDGLRPDATTTHDRRGFEWHYMNSIREQFTSEYTHHERGGEMVGCSGRFGYVMFGLKTFQPDVPGLKVSWPVEVKIQNGDFNTGCINAQGDQIACITNNSSCHIYTPSTIDNPRHLETECKLIHIVAFTPNQKYLIRNGYRYVNNEYIGRCDVWDTQTWKRIQSWDTPGTFFRNMTISPDSKQILFMGNWQDDGIEMRDIETGQVTTPRELPKANHGSFSPCSHLLALTKHTDNHIYLYDTRNWKQVNVLTTGLEMSGPMSFNTRSNVLAVGTTSGVILSWQLDSERKSKLMRGHRAAINSIAFLYESDSIISSCIHWRKLFWTYTTVEHAIPVDPSQEFRDFTIISGDSRVAVTSAANNEFGFAGVGEQSRWLKTGLSGDKAVVLTASLDGEFLYVKQGANSFVRLRPKDASLEEISIPNCPGMAQAEISPDGQFAVWSDKTRTLMIQSMKNPDSPPRAIPLKSITRRILFSPDGELVHIQSESFDWCVVSLRHATILHMGNDHYFYYPPSVAFSNDHRLLALCSDNSKNIKIYDTSTFKLIHELQTHSTVCSALAINQDKTRLIATFDDHRLRMWNLQDGSELLSIEIGVGRVKKLAFSEDQKSIYLLAGSKLSVISSDRSYYREVSHNIREQLRTVAVNSRQITAKPGELLLYAEIENKSKRYFKSYNFENSDRGMDFYIRVRKKGDSQDGSELEPFRTPILGTLAPDCRKHVELRFTHTLPPGQYEFALHQPVYSTHAPRPELTPWTEFEVR